MDEDNNNNNLNQQELFENFLTDNGILDLNIKNGLNNNLKSTYNKSIMSQLNVCFFN